MHKIGFKSEEECKKAVRTGDLTPAGKYKGKWIDNFGRETFLQFCKIFKVHPESAHIIKMIKTLESYGYKVTKD